MGVTSNCACSLFRAMNLTEKRGTIVSCDESVQFFNGTNLTLITKILHTYLLFYISSWYIYEIKIHVKYIYCHKFETKLLLITGLQSRKIGKSQSSFTWQSVKGGCNIYALFNVNAPVIRKIYILLPDPELVECSYTPKLTFHPVHEVPMLQGWFASYRYPSDSQLQQFCAMLNESDVRKERGRPVSLINLQHWWRNERAKFRRSGESSIHTSSGEFHVSD